MDEQAFKLMMQKLDNIDTNTETTMRKQEDFEKRLNKGALTFQAHDNRIEDLEENKVSLKRFNDDVQPLKRAEASRKGFKMWAVKVCTAAGLAGIGAWIGKTF